MFERKNMNFGAEVNNSSSTHTHQFIFLPTFLFLKLNFLFKKQIFDMIEQTKQKSWEKTTDNSGRYIFNMFPVVKAGLL